MPEPPQAIAEEVNLPPGTPKVLDAEVGVAIAGWLSSLSSPIASSVVVGSYAEAGFRCILACGATIEVGSYLEEGEVVVGINGLHADDDTAVPALLSVRSPTGPTLFTLWVHSGDGGDSNGAALPHSEEHPSFKLPDEVVKRTDSYFGFTRLDLEGAPAFLWHCNSFYADRVLVQRRGPNVQMLGLPADEGGPSATSAQAGDLGPQPCSVDFQCS